MESLKKIINLNEAAKLSGYTQDYLGYLIRNGEMKGRKVGRSWVTTKEEIDNYLFKQKVRHESFPLRGFFSRRRAHHISIVTMALFAGVFIVFFYVANKNVAGQEKVSQKLSSDVEVVEIIK